MSRASAAMAALLLLPIVAAGCGRPDSPHRDSRELSRNRGNVSAITRDRAELIHEERASRGVRPPLPAGPVASPSAGRAGAKAPSSARPRRTPAPGPGPGGPPTSDAWARLRACESGGRYDRNSGNGYYGAVQWLPSTWNAAVRLVGRPEYANGRADLAPPAIQDQAAVAWQATHGWGQWPACSRALGLR